MYGNRHPVLERTVEEGFLYTLIIYAFCFSLLSLGLAGRRDTSHMRACMRDTCSRQPHAASCRRAGSCSVGVRGRGWTRRVERLERDHDLRSLLAPQCAAGAAPKLRTKSPGATMNKTIGTVRLPKLLVASRAAHPCAARYMRARAPPAAGAGAGQEGAALWRDEWAPLQPGRAARSL